MFEIERYLSKLNSYVRNRSKPKGSIAEGYLTKECVTFCSRFLGDAIKTKIDKNINVGYLDRPRRNKDGQSLEFVEKVWIKVHRYVLFNIGNVKIEKLIGDVLIYS